MNKATSHLMDTALCQAMAWPGKGRLDFSPYLPPWAVNSLHPTPAPLPLPLGATSVLMQLHILHTHGFLSAPFSSSLFGSFLFFHLLLLFSELIASQNKSYTCLLNVCVAWCGTYSVCVHCYLLLGGVSSSLSLRAWHIVGAQDRVTGVCVHACLSSLDPQPFPHLSL